MSGFTSDFDQKLDVVFGEFRDHLVVTSFVDALRKTNLIGTLYLGYPVLAIDDDRVEFDAILLSSDRGLIIFDLYSYQGRNSQDTSAISDSVTLKLEQRYAALYNKLNSFKELRHGRKLIVEISTVCIDPTRSIFKKDEETFLLSLDHLQDLPILDEKDRIDNIAMQHLNAAIQRISRIVPAKKRDKVNRLDSWGAKIKAIENQIANLDLWQKRGAIEYVNGPQRIRGLAGSGKTVVLALKAAYLHVKRPDWDIVVTFSSRSLYQQFEDLITRFVYTQIDDKPNWEKLHIMHAWGNWERPGIYSDTAKRSGALFRDFGTAARMFGYNTALAGACNEIITALSSRNLERFDAVLVDEAQDLPASFFQLIYRLTKDPKRIVWAYDDLQNLGDYQMPSGTTLFGNDEQGHPLVKLVNAPDAPQQDIVLPRCYRNPPWTLVTAHGLGFGTARNKLIQIFPDPEIWRRLGYKEINGKLEYDQDVTVERDSQSVPEFFDKNLKSDDSIQVVPFDDRATQYDWVAREIKRLLDNEELEYSDFLIVIPEAYTSKSVGVSAIKALENSGLNGHLVGVTSSKDSLFQEGSIAITHIHRAKGNEAPIIFILNADYCDGSVEPKKRRNILFTAITRSRAWTFICGLKAGMQHLIEEFEKIRNAGYRLSFHYPPQSKIELISVSAPESDISQNNSPEKEDLQKILEKHWDSLPVDLQEELSEVMGSGS